MDPRLLRFMAAKAATERGGTSDARRAAMSGVSSDGEDDAEPHLSSAEASARSFIRAFAERRDAPPPPIISERLPPRRDAVAMHELSLRENAQAQRSGGVAVRHTIEAPFTHGVAPALESLTPISLAEVARRVNGVWLGRVLFARTVAAPYREVGTTLLVEDLAGDAVAAALYNYVPAERAPAEVFPVGTRLALLEPYMRHARDDADNGKLMLRCDNPQAVVLFDNEAAWRTAAAAAAARADAAGSAAAAAPDTPPLPPRRLPPEAAARLASELVGRGNAAYAAGKPAAALKSYDAALQLQPGSTRARGNRAAALLALRRFEDALADAREVLREEPRNVKSRLRAAAALLCLQRCAEARDEAAAIAADLAAAAAEGRTSSAAAAKLRCDAQELLRDAERAAAQQRGDYDLPTLEREAYGGGGGGARRLSPRHAEFEHPAVTVAQPEPRGSAKGRRVVAAQALPPETLLMACRAFAFVPGITDDDVAVGRGATFAHFGARGDGGSASVSVNANAELLPCAIAELIAHPERGAELYSLDAGPDAPRVPADPSRVEVRRISGVIATNVFSTDTRKAARDLDTMRWAARMGREPRPDELERRDRELQMRPGSGLWLRASLFNHSCAPNCMYTVLSDFIFVFTTRDVAAGEELCVPYLSPLMPFAERERKFASWSMGVGFSCACERCAATRAAPGLARIEAELEAATQRAIEHSATSASSPFAPGAPSAAANAAMPRARRAKLRAAIEAIPPHCHAALVPLLDLEAGALLDKRDYIGALQLYERAAQARAAVCGSAPSLQHGALKDLMRVAIAAVLAHPPGAAAGRDAMRRLVRGAVRGVARWGTLGADDVAALLGSYTPPEAQRAVQAALKDAVDAERRSGGGGGAQKGPGGGAPKGQESRAKPRK